LANSIFNLDRIKSFAKSVRLPAGILVIYLILLAVLPEKSIVAFEACGRILKSLIVPFCLVFVVMFLMNLFVKPTQIVRFLGKGAGIKGVILSVAAGIISTGPIYAWYPLLKDLKEKGATNYLVTVFLYNRAVKPFLLPIIIGYFGWIYVVILTIVTVIASVVVGYIVEFLTFEKPLNIRNIEP